jgi:hypothetical protein
MSNSTGCGIISKRMTSSIFSSMIGIDLVVRNTPPAVRKSRSASRASSASRSEPQTVGMSFSSFGRQVVEVLVHGLARVDLVLDPVEAGHQHGRERQVRVGRRVGEADLDALGLRGFPSTEYGTTPSGCGPSRPAEPGLR